MVTTMHLEGQPVEFLVEQDRRQVTVVVIGLEDDFRMPSEGELDVLATKLCEAIQPLIRQEQLESITSGSEEPPNVRLRVQFRHLDRDTALSLTFDACRVLAAEL